MVEELTSEKTRLNEELQQLLEQKSSCNDALLPVGSDGRSSVLVNVFEELQSRCNVVHC